MVIKSLSAILALMMFSPIAFAEISTLDMPGFGALQADELCKQEADLDFFVFKRTVFESLTEDRSISLDCQNINDESVNARTTDELNNACLTHPNLKVIGYVIDTLYTDEERTFIENEVPYCD